MEDSVVENIDGEKTTKPGIIYLSRIPQFMSVKKVREIFSQYGIVGRVFLQVDERAPASKKNRAFTEGWVEFEDKKTAKIVARTLNNNQIGGKRRNPWYYELWNIKYLPKFQWAHLNERLAYERAVHKQRLRAEISQAKKETSKFIQNVERQKFRKRKAEPTDGDAVDRPFVFKQIKTDDQLSKKFKNPKQVVAMDQNFMKNIFSGGV